MVLDKKNIHFVGIGGIGMSGIAKVLLEMRYRISGSDAESNSITNRLEAIGGRIFEGHSPSNLSKDVEALVYSSSISEDNPEMVEARRRNITIVHRAEILGELFNKKKGIAVTGTHGKTTTTSLVAVMLEGCGLDPTAIIGGEVSQFKSNAKFGKGKYIVAEADESDSSFTNLKPFYSVLTNMEMEHLDHYKNLEHLERSFDSFIKNTKEGGMVFYNRDDDNLTRVVKESGKRAESFGFSEISDIYPVDIKMDGFKTSFRCVYKKKPLGRIDLRIPGRHNILNAMAAVLVGLKLKIDFKDIARALKKFDGAKRRFQLRAEAGGVMLIDDYAHHPTEIRAVLDACKGWKDKRIVAVFQPHRYTRTKFLADDFGKCFIGVDKLILTDIYAASEKAIEGISINTIYEKVRDSGVSDVVVLRKDQIPEYLMKLKRAGDIILIMGAGDIKKTADDFSAMLSQRDCGNIARDAAGKDTVAELRKAIRGDIKVKEPMASHTSFKIGGPADIWVEPSDALDLKKVIIFSKAHKIPLRLIGNGSNILVNDDGFRGMVVQLNSPYFKNISIKGRNATVGSGFSLAKLVRLCCSKGLSGLESMVGIPGSVGGAIYMNAGGSKNPVYKNIGDLVESVRVMDYNGHVMMLKKADLKFGYRSSNLGKYIILEARLKLDNGEADSLVASCAQFLNIKREKQALDVPSAGCVFKNPESFQFSCGQMIDMLGLKGKRVGGAEVSEKHANFVVNKKRATCKDVLALIEFVKNKVKENYGVSLELEIEIV